LFFSTSWLLNLSISFIFSLTPGIKIHLNGTANRRIPNKEPQNFEGWFRSRSAGACASWCSVFYKQTEYLPSTFDIYYSIFDIRFFKVSIFDQTGHLRLPAAPLTPET
jgi:hypothetical protein